ncbi:hypothetical protein EV121DRAFT_266870 [Schizophyllum commune]
MSFPRLELIKFAWIHLLRVESAEAHQYVADFECTSARELHLEYLRDQIRRQYSSGEAREWKVWELKDHLYCEFPPEMIESDPLSTEKYRLTCFFLGRMVRYVGWHGHFLAFVDRIWHLSNLAEVAPLEATLLEEFAEFTRYHAYSFCSEIYTGDMDDYVVDVDESLLLRDLWTDGLALTGIFPTP